MDYRTFYNPEGLVAIVYEFNTRTGGIKTCCEHGVITHDGSKGLYVVAVDRYVLNAPAGMYVPLPEKLAEVRKKVEDGLFDKKKVQESLTARCTKGRLMPTVLSRNQRGVSARKESVQRIVDAERRNSAATVGACATVTVEDEARIDSEEVTIVCRVCFGILFVKIV